MDGTLINLARVIVAGAAALGVTARRFADGLLRKEVYAWVWGDDTLLGVPRAFDWDKYIAVSAALGYVCKKSDAPVFLMTYYDEQRYTNLGARTFEGTVWREHEARTPAFEMLGMVARFEMTSQHPLAASIWKGVQRVGVKSGFAREWNVESLGELKARVGSPAFRKALEVEAKEDPRRARNLMLALSSGRADDATTWSDVYGGGELAYYARISGLNDAVERGTYTPPPEVLRARSDAAGSKWKEVLKNANDVYSDVASRRTGRGVADKEGVHNGRDFQD
jgi:hypothetical protein